MITDFYWICNEDGQLPGGIALEGGESEDHPKFHIGKRAAAGLYCWDCGIPLVRPGTRRDGYGEVYMDADVVHGGRHTDAHPTSCPLCTRYYVPPAKLDLSAPGHPAGVELGFAKPLEHRPTGISGASSFSWAQEPARALRILLRFQHETLVRDEYDRTYTGKQFSDMLLLTPMWFTTSVGTFFS